MSYQRSIPDISIGVTPRFNFTPGGIHDKFEFWDRELHAGSWVLDLIENGYKVPFVKEPDASEFDNNASVKHNMAVAEEQVKQLLQQGVLRRVSSKPHCVNPLGLVTRIVNGAPKHRLIFDGSRIINDNVAPPGVKLAYLQKALLKISRDHLLGIFDLKSCYFHVKIHASQTTYFGVKLAIDGVPTYMVYDFLPFGLNSAVHCITKIWKPLIAYFQMKNIPISVYIDDGLFSAANADSWNHMREFIWDVLAKAGWTIETDKSDGRDMGSVAKHYLGFVVNTHAMKVFLPSEKVQDLDSLLTDFVKVSECSAKKLAKVLGKVVACIPSHGPLARVCTRSGYRDIQEGVDRRGWSTRVLLSSSTLQELLLFQQVLRSRNGYPILHNLTDLRVDTVFSQPISKIQVLHQARQDYSAVVASDASDFKVACKWLEGDVSGALSFNLTEEEQAFSSGERELLAMLRSFYHFKNVLQIRNVNFIWATDSENLVSFINKRSPKERIHKKITEIYSLCHQMNCTVEPVHLLREDERIQQVDHLSKVKNSDNWSIDDYSFQVLRAQFGFTIDVFADSKNCKLDSFISEFYEPGCFGVDAFACNWPGIAWVCPPTKLLARIAQRVRKSHCEGVILMPNWPASDFYTSFFGDNLTVKQPFQLVKEFNPYIFQNENATNTPLFGVTQFTFFVLYFNTK